MTVSEQAKTRAQWIGEHRCFARKQLLLLHGFREHGEEPVHNVRQAKVIAHVLDHYPVVIGEGDLLVGKYTTEPLTEAENAELRAGDELLKRFQRGLWYGPGSGGVGGHRTVDFETLLRLGVRGILDDVERRESTIDDASADTAEKRQFYEACRVTLTALVRFAERHRQRVEELCDVEPDPCRKQELARLAAILERVPARPPRDFYEALQSVWFVQFALGFDDVSCTGHPDRYMSAHK